MPRVSVDYLDDCLVWQSESEDLSPPAERLEVLADGHPLSVWVKRPASPQRAILLLHGRTWSALPNFDLKVDGQQRSVMDKFFKRGYAVYALDQRGYGATPRDSSGWMTPTRAAEDAAIVLDWISTREEGLGERPVLLGYSRGSRTALHAAQLYPNDLSKLVLYAFTFNLEDEQGTVTTPSEPPRERNSPEAAAADFITEGAAPEVVVDAYVRETLASDPVRVDWTNEHEYNDLDPSLVRVPTLIIHGVADPGTTAVKDMNILSRLGTSDRSLVILPFSDHAAHVEDSQVSWVDTIVSFIERPR